LSGEGIENERNEITQLKEKSLADNISSKEKENLYNKIDSLEKKVIDKIEEILRNNPGLNKEYKKRKRNDEDFRTSEWEQLYFIYKQSPYYEKSVNILPIYFSP